MPITKDNVVQFNYTLKDEKGETLESNSEQDPIAYLHGHRNMMVGVENALEGKELGESFSVTLPAAETYGEKAEDSEQRVSVKHLIGAKVWKARMQATINTDQGQRLVTIVKIGKFMATIDANHPLAGRELTFDISVVDVRDATNEEIAHGHAHGVGGHHH